MTSTERRWPWLLMAALIATATYAALHEATRAAPSAVDVAPGDDVDRDVDGTTDADDVDRGVDVVVQEPLPTLPPCKGRCTSRGYWIWNGTAHQQGFSTEDFWRMSLEPKQPPARCYGARPGGRRLRIALVTFATGRYTSLLPGFVSSAHRFFFPPDDVTVFVFTNRPQDVPSPTPGPTVRVMNAAYAPWPESSMQRFRLLVENRDTFAGFDYVYSHDVDYEYLWYVCDEYLGDLVGALHPGANCRVGDTSLPYERNSASTAYVPYEQTRFYYHGSQYGGRPERVHHLAQTCMNNQEIDQQNGVHALVDDESHLNRYFTDHPANKTFTFHYVSTGDSYGANCFWPIIMHRSKDNSQMRAGDVP